MLTRWSDFGNLEREFASLNDLRRQMNYVFADFERGWGLGETVSSQTGANAGGWPRVSLYDAGTELQLRAEVPGLSEANLNITLEQSSLSIRGERKVEVPEGYAVHRQERGAVTFARSFSLPCRVDAEKTTAKLTNGVLVMTLPKVVEEQPRQIKVRAS